MEESQIPTLKPFWQQKYKATSAKNWDMFYKRNTVNFFKDRHWLDAEFPALLSQQDSVGMEVGCGVGNLVFPALERNETSKLFACDFSANAIAFVKSREEYDGLYEGGRLVAFVADITGNEPFALISPDSLDFITCIFVLSAIPPAQHAQVLQNFLPLMKPNGVICLRDYAVGDLALQRFQKAAEIPKLEDFLYVRQDGTMSYFFSKEYFENLVHQVPGLKIRSLNIVERRTTNVKRGLDEARYFIQAVLYRDL